MNIIQCRNSGAGSGHSFFLPRPTRPWYRSQVSERPWRRRPPVQFERMRLSVQAISWVLENSQSRLGPRHVLISIANHAKRDGTGAWPSIKTIALESRLSEREVQYALRTLVSIGELAIQQGEGPHGTNLYSMPMMGAKSAPANSAGCKIQQTGVQISAEMGVDFAPEPSLKQPSLEDKPSLAFNQFWESYPRKVGKVTALKVWDKLSLDRISTHIMEGLTTWTYSLEWSDPKFVPHPTTFLNQRRWEELPMAQPRSEAQHGTSIVASLSPESVERLRARRGMR